jgi:hypothetical protein
LNHYSSPLNFLIMGTTVKGIMGNVSGTVGTVVGATWRGKAYLRSKPERKKNAKRSDKQLAQQTKFSMANALMQGMKDLLAIGFRTLAVGQTGGNKALSHMLKKAITNTGSGLQIDFNKVMISQGTLVNAFDTKATAANAAIKFTWTDNSIVSNASANDRVLLVAYCPEFNCTVYRTGAARSAGTDTLEMPGFTGKLVQTWVTFQSEDEADIATSLYTGAITVS